MKKTELKGILKNIKKGLCVLTATAMVNGFSGCSRKDDESSINIIDDGTKYTYIVNNRAIPNDKLSDELNELFNNMEEEIDLLRVIRDDLYTSNLFGKGKFETKATFCPFFENLVFPVDYTPVSPISDLIDTSLRYQDFEGFNPNYKYRLVEAELKVKEDIPQPFEICYFKQLKKGDVMSSRAFYVQIGDGFPILIAYEQSGVGSYCENVKEKEFGDIDSILISLGFIPEERKGYYDYTKEKARNFVKSKDARRLAN